MNLHDLIAKLSVEEREALAKKVPTEAGYLWQLSKQWRGKKPSLGLMQKLVAADPRLTLAELVEEFAGAGSETAGNQPTQAAHGAANGKPKKPRREGPNKSDAGKPSNKRGR